MDIYEYFYPPNSQPIVIDPDICWYTPTAEEKEELIEELGWITPSPPPAPAPAIEIQEPKPMKEIVAVAPIGNQPPCHVCDSPTANTLHFGGRSCKACAAFFRRSVAMSMTYECIDGTSTAPCKIHYELRMLCRHCRFIKCLDAGMKTELVQAKKEEVKIGKRRSRGLVRNQESPTKQESAYEEYVNNYNNYTNNQAPSPKSEAECSDPVYQSPPVPPTSSEMAIPSISPPPVVVQFANSTTPFYTLSPFDPAQPSTSEAGSSSNGYYIQQQIITIPMEIQDEKIFYLVDHYVRTEASLNDRRKIMYTDTPIRDVFDTTCECPFERHHLQLFSHKNFCGFVKHDFVMILDYINQFPEFSKLNKNEKNMFYRMACAVDSMLCSAYYTYRIGIDDERLILFNGHYIPMNPLPMTGDEPEARKEFENDEDLEKYRTLMSLKLKQYTDLAIPFSKLEVSFEEFVLIKALTIWHISNYKFLEEGRAICARQRDAIIQSLHRVVEERGDENSAVRVGQLLLSMSYIMEQVQAMTSSYLLITFFGIVNCDSIMHDLLTFK